jgi:hypothetical protein
MPIKLLDLDANIIALSKWYNIRPVYNFRPKFCGQGFVPEFCPILPSIHSQAKNQGDVLFDSRVYVDIGWPLAESMNANSSGAAAAVGITFL